MCGPSLHDVAIRIYMYVLTYHSSSRTVKDAILIFDHLCTCAGNYIEAPFIHFASIQIKCKGNANPSFVAPLVLTYVYNAYYNDLWFFALIFALS